MLVAFDIFTNVAIINSRIGTNTTNMQNQNPNKNQTKKHIPQHQTNNYNHHHQTKTHQQNTNANPLRSKRMEKKKKRPGDDGRLGPRVVVELDFNVSAVSLVRIEGVVNPLGGLDARSMAAANKAQAAPKDQG